MQEKDIKLVEEIKAISKRGGHAEVKEKDGHWVVYEVQKKKRVG